MPLSFKHIIVLLLAVQLLASCAVSKKFPAAYYKENEATIVKMEATYNKIAAARPLSIGFTDKEFRHVLVEMKTDTVRYVYEFNLNDPSLFDSLQHYGYDTAATASLMQYMKKTQCTWINMLDYYTSGRKQLLTFMSIRHKSLSAPFSQEKYFILTFYKQPQYYDENGILLDRRNLRRARKVNNEIFRRINDRVCYTISAKFR
jgi:hypothetical protein